MSGPKVDTAALRRERLQKLEQARNQRLSLAGQIQSSLTQVQNCLGQEFQLIKQDASLEAYCQKCTLLQSQCEKQLKKMLQQVKNGNELLDIQEISREHTRLMQDFKEQMHIGTRVLNDKAQASQTIQNLRREQERLAHTRKIIIQRMTQDTSAQDARTLQNQVQEQYQIFQDEIAVFLESEEMTGSHRNSVLLIRQDLDELMHSSLDPEIRQKRMKRLFQEYQKLIMLIHTNISGMKAIYEEYQKECFDASAPALKLTEFASKAELEAALLGIKEKAKNHLAQEYIRRQIDEVMAKHGYDVIRSDMLEEVNASGQVLYGVDEGTAINVFVSDENQVTMRVVGIGFDTAVSEAEDERLFQQQCAFCSMHPQIVKELSMRGVELQAKKHMPPDKKFNKKIKTRAKSESESRSRSRKELKQQDKKVMYRS